ncbi:MAG: sigma-54 dependent transcriptional regulator [Planctomycetes bacterium]|nr:sigma-54 dependent transcriptional regulator [Planctomycetota bacterium]
MKVLLADDEKIIRVTLADELKEAGHDVVTVSNGVEALEAYENQDFDCLITDVRMPGIEGIDLMKRIKEKNLAFPVIVITAAASIESAVEAMRAGAENYIKKPFDNREVIVHLEKLRSMIEVRNELAELKGMSVTDFDGMIGQSKKMREIFDQIKSIASSDFGVLIQGENGTGKELIAAALHSRSDRATKPFVAVNCAAFNENIIESELFGHKQGAFTGAIRDHKGKFQTASTGTLFLDEIGEMPMSLQVKLLRVLETNTVTPVGSDDTREIDVRLVAATNRDLEEMVKEDEFREDLFFRLNVISLYIPPLRDRAEDIPLLANHFIKKYAPDGRFELTDDLVIALMSYSWPGNVRELENSIKRAVALSGGSDKLKKEHLIKPASTRRERPATSSVDLRPLKEVLQEAEIKHIRQVLKYTSSQKAKAADVLGISRKSLWEKMRELQME